MAESLGLDVVSLSISTDKTLVLPTNEKTTSTESFSAPVVRKLVTLRRIAKITPLKDAKLKSSKFVVITVDGWEVVVNTHRDQRWFQKGEVVVFFQIDSFVPSSDGNFWEEMATSWSVFQHTRGFRVQTLRIGKSSVISQGRVFHLREYPRIQDIVSGLQKLHGKEAGLEIAMKRSFDDILGVIKWDVDGCDKGRNYGSPPPMIPHTGSHRVQDVIALWENHATTRVQITEKLDGYPISVYFVCNDSPFAKCLPELHVFADDATADERQRRLCVFPHGRVGVCAGNLDLVCAPGEPHWEVVERLGIPERMAREGRTAVVQGELVGPAVLPRDSLGYGADAPNEFYAFSLWSERGAHDGFDAEEVQRETLTRMGVPVVPLIGYMPLQEFARSTAEMLRHADGEGFRGRGHMREGFVLRNAKENIKIKVISNAWLWNYLL